MPDDARWRMSTLPAMARLNFVFRLSNRSLRRQRVKPNSLPTKQD